ncbi:MAG: cyclic nucleotide-binding domain-containing protein [Nitrospinae bacterium]|nr:cyclic nucleotide-binding domain-containing protein [Nitrospinota bacterium]
MAAILFAFLLISLNISDDELLTFFKSLDQPVSYDGQTEIIKQGSVDNTSFIVLDGECGVFKMKDGKKNKVDKIGKTQVIGEMSEFIEGERTTSVIVTSFNAKLLKINIKKLPYELRVKIREEQCMELARKLINEKDQFVKVSNDLLDLKDNFDDKFDVMISRYEKEIENYKGNLKILEDELKRIRVLKSKEKEGLAE